MTRSTRTPSRQHILAALMATAVAAAATGCGTHRADPQPATPATTSPSLPSHGQAVDASQTTVTVSDGTNSVAIGGKSVRFASSVTDAQWSPDGSRLAYVDGDGNIATALPDGSDVRVLTKAGSGIKRAHPTWADAGGSIVFSERGRDGVWRLERVSSNGDDPLRAQAQPERASDPAEWEVYVGENTRSAGDTAPSAVGKSTGLLGHFSVDRLAFQHATKAGPQVWIVDNNQREPQVAKLGSGSQPALSPSGDNVAFIGAGGQLFVERVDTVKPAKATQITFGVRGLSAPVWSPDGKRVTFGTSSDVESVSATPAAGATTNPTRVESTRPGIATYQPSPSTTTYRVSNTDPVSAAIAYSQSRWYTASENGDMTTPFDMNASGVLLIDDRSRAVATSAIEFGQGTGPVLFVHGSSLAPAVKAELSRTLRPHGAPVTVAGNVSSTIVAQVRAMGYPVQRMGTYGVPQPTVFSDAVGVVVESNNDPAAIADGALLTQSLGVTPLLLDGPSFSPAQRAAINALGTRSNGAPAPKIYALGSNAVAALSQPWAGRPALSIVNLTANDSSDESLGVVMASDVTPLSVALAPASSWQMQLLAALTHAPVLLVGPNGGLSDGAKQWLTRSAGSISMVFAFGPAASVPDSSVKAAAAAISGPGGYAAATLPHQH